MGILGLPRHLHALFIDWKRQTEIILAKERLTAVDVVELTKLLSAEKKIGFEFDIDEPGYHQGMVAGFAWVKNNLNKTLTVDGLIALHDACIGGVRHENGEPFEFGLKHSNNNYAIRVVGLPAPTSSAQKEWESEKLIKPTPQDHSYIATLVSTQNHHPYIKAVLRSNITPAKAKIFTEQLIQQYNKDIEKAKTPDNKLKIIAQFIRKLEIAHIFDDGNGRTVDVCLLNKLLMENGFPPTILETNMTFAGIFSTAEMVKEIRLGFERFAERSRIAQCSPITQENIFDCIKHNVNRPGECTPLELAIESKNPKIVQVLIAAKANVNATRWSTGDNALHVATELSVNQPEIAIVIIEHLIAAGANINSA